MPRRKYGIVGYVMQLTLLHKYEIAAGVWSFTFSPDQPLVWQAGQFVRVSIPHSQPDAKGTTRWFTISAAPYEADITITTRLTGSSFKRTLAELPIGSRIHLAEQPAGDFIWHQAEQPHIFAAQGIGITPYYAIIKDRMHRGLPVQATLIYGSQPDTEIIYQSELAQWAAADPTLKVIHESGTLTPARTAELAGDLSGRYIYVSGPKSFIGLALPPHNVPLNRLKQDNFPGYAAIKY